MVALSEIAVLNWRFGGGRGFEHGRTEVQTDELCHLNRNADGTVSILSPNKDTWLSVQEDGSLQERPSDIAPGPWEKFLLDGNILTELPKEGITRPMKKFISL